GSFFLYKRISGNPFQLSEIADRRAERVSQLDGYLSPKRESATKYIQHPFLGYVGRPGGLNWSGRQTFNHLGTVLPQGVELPYRRRPDDYVIAVTGGSVAEQVAVWM